MSIVSSDRKHHVDEKFDSDIRDADYSNSLFVRLIAKGKRFEKIAFKYSIFDNCYLQNCVFDSCDFTGCRFIGVNLCGARFEGCTFDYVNFERTIIDSEILENGCPGWENLKLKFARTLRMNFQQIGDTQAVNKAIKVELDATESHLFKAWKSNESYYRKKYKGLARIKQFFEWINFKTLGLVWGNGESPIKLLRFVFIVLLLMTVCDVFMYKDATRIVSYWNSFISMPEIFFGVTTPQNYNKAYLVFIVFIRLVLIGFFMSIIVKRFNRR
ncbi:MAG: putative plasmid protein [uncultured bacterium]|nr:MAG: putative plasmid protein [uncultured bacterium]